jgi:shikimate kinase
MNSELHKEKRSRLALVGMSGSGKSFWTKKLAAAGWRSVCCDDLIEQRLAPRLAAGGYSGINGVAAWMGWPNSVTYVQREAEYLAEEIGVMDEFLNNLEKETSGLGKDSSRLEKDSSGTPIVLDTTGSVIYAQNNILMRLRRQMTVVHLANTVQEQRMLVERYLNDPKPVLWRGTFHVKDQETPRETVARCYPLLIAARRKSYETLAHCSVQVSELHAGYGGDPKKNSADVERFLQKVREQVEHT